ncbi:MAG: ABC transporter permease subunit [Acidobacteria bacterium]|nr:ABC transporter permease subunit [Acidobacteriota bacterium]
MTLARTSRRRRLADRGAGVIVSAGGMLIIAGILGILFFIVVEVLPLAAGARVTGRAPVRLDGPAPGGLVADERRAQVATLAADGVFRITDATDGHAVFERRVAESFAATIVSTDGRHVAGSTADGKLVLVPARWTQSVEPRSAPLPVHSAPIEITVDPAGRETGVFTAAVEGSRTLGAAQLADGSIAVARKSVEENAITGETSEAVSRFTAPDPGRLTALLADPEGRNLYGGAADGRILWWPLREAGIEPARTSRAGAKITSLALLAGHRSLVVGQEDGSVSVWLQVPRDDGRELTRIRDFPRRRAPNRALAASPRGRVFMAMDASGSLALVSSTAEKVQWSGEAPSSGVSTIAFAPRGDAIFLAGGGALSTLDVVNPHPEISWMALFGKIWYEGYPAPAYVWQSSGGSDDFEPKLSLVPLLAGTLKGTFYSLVLAVPLGILGAVYASQFIGSKVRRLVKPAVEIMAALPSVVLGFIAGLWLAPRIERLFPALILMIVVLPASGVIAHFVWRAVPRRITARFAEGTELSVFIVALAAGGALSVALGARFQATAFGGSFPIWLRQATGLPFDQRNAIVVGIAMGFAVIPIIFSITEDALTNVPRHLASASLALGATKWQTVARVVLPAASPGIFAAVMVGFGRAVGETMIVVMATGNTPILDWNPWNGFRTLSANIAIEIPEAAQGATLYRTLFLSALLLFALTFVVNSAAEIVRQRLRRRYSVL